jgi:Ca-activated chloride channel family protein
MRRSASRACLVAAAVCAALVATAGAQNPAPVPQFRAGVSLVRLPVVVTARDGQIVRGLTAADFRVTEDGRPQTIAHFVEGAAGETLPLHLGLVLDGSESMERDLREAANAAVRFVEALEEAVDVTFMDFDTAVNIGRFTPPSYWRLFERIRERKAGGGTSLYDAIGTYIESSLGRPGQHVLLLYTDGGDSTSRMTFGKLLDLLRLGNVLVYAVGYLDHQSSSTRGAQQMGLSQIAHEAGGEAFFPSSPGAIHEVYAKILDELASRYTLGYVTSSTKPAGKFRRVEVKLTRADLRGVKVRTRPGYLPLPLPAGGGR